ncbi:hypothetical protein QYF61_012872 [Mycteria americana]|uniref:Uncharacterized protein n=1 Tax=Mycteria americana TaxID=33587 RepID=A0AAN7SJP5_MYCAM|nr:hypothetical protein QYF61_012872 [Mycteria americana]
MAFDCLQGGRFHNVSGHSVPVVSHPHSKKVFPDVHRQPPVFQFVPIASCPVTGHHQIQPGSVFSTPSLQVFIYIDKMSPQPSLLQAQQSQLSQPFLIGEMLQSLHHLHGPLLDSLQRGLTSAEQRGRITSLNLLAILCLMQPRITLAFFATRDPQIRFCRAAFQLGGPQYILVPGVVPAQVQDFVLLLVELHEVPVGLFLLPVEVPLDGSMTFWCISHSSQFGVICKLFEGTLAPSARDHAGSCDLSECETLMKGPWKATKGLPPLSHDRLITRLPCQAQAAEDA